MLKRYTIVIKHVRQLTINSPIKVSPTSLWYKNKMKRETRRNQPLVTVQDFSALLYVYPCMTLINVKKDGLMLRLRNLLLLKIQACDV